MYYFRIFPKFRFNIRNVLIFGFCCPLITSSLISVYKQLPFVNKHLLIYDKNDYNQLLVSQLGPLDDYRPTFYLPTCIAQMIYNEFKQVITIDFKREYIQTNDGGIISLDWANPAKMQKEECRLIVILHGLTGGSESNYIREIVKELNENERNIVVVVQYRGVNDSPLLTPKTYHMGETDDIKLALNYLRSLYPNLPCYTIGTSMGANILVKLFSHDHSFDDYVKGFISISNPFNILAIERRNHGTALDYFIKLNQQKYIKRHYEILKKLPYVDIDKVFKIKYYRDFDEHYTIKMFNFDSVDEYYTKVSSYLDVGKLQIPTFFINSMNDRLSSYNTLNLDLCIIF